MKNVTNLLAINRHKRSIKPPMVCQITFKNGPCTLLKALLRVEVI